MGKKKKWEMNKNAEGEIVPGVPPSLSYCSLGPGSWKRGKRLSVCQSRSLFGLNSDLSRGGALSGVKLKRRWYFTCIGE